MGGEVPRFRLFPEGREGHQQLRRGEGRLEMLWTWLGKQYGHGSKSGTPSEHPNPTTQIGSKMGGEFTYPKMGSNWF